MRARGAEQAEHRVADELVHGPAEADQLLADRLVVRAQQAPHVLRVVALGPLREALEVAEERADDLALLVGRLRRARQRRAARPAEPEPGWYLGATARALHWRGITAAAGRCQGRWRRRAL